jgi:4-amino-4-deoxy-L-arabinose transferase-like glycosyltransferase
MADRLPQATAGSQPADAHGRGDGEPTGEVLRATDRPAGTTRDGGEGSRPATDAGSPEATAIAEAPDRRPLLGRFGWWLVAISLGALAARLAYLVGWRTPWEVAGDPFYYHHGANLLADGEGYVQPHLFVLDGMREPGADHPPAFLTVLAGFSWLGFRSFFSHQVIGTLLGTLGVAAIGLAGRRIAGERVGLIAAGLAAVSPNLFFFDAAVLSETLVVLATAIVLLAAYRWWDRPSLAMAAVFGLAVGAAALVRSELLLLGPAIAVPLLWWRRDRGREERQLLPRLRQLAVVGAAAAAVIAPWVGYNLARFEEPTTLSLQIGATLGAANCDDVYYGDLLGYWNNACNVRVDHLVGEGDSSERAAGFARIARQYVGDNAGRVPSVVAARVGRTFGVFAPRQQIDLDFAVESKERPLGQAGMLMWYVVAAAAVAGLATLRRAGRPIFPIVATVASVTVTVAVVYGATRFRLPAEVVLLIPAAVALDAGLRAAHRRWRAWRGAAEVNAGRAVP